MLIGKTAGFSIKMTHLWILALVVFFSVNMNYDWRSEYLVWYGSLALIAATYILAFNGKIRVENFSFWAWILSFFLLGVISISWCLSTSVAMDVIKSYIVSCAVLVLVQSSLNYRFGIDTMLKGYLVATLINAVYVILAIDVAKLGEIQLGDNLIEGWNGNGIGFLMAQGALIGCYLLRRTSRKSSKYFYLAAIAALSLLVVYTGSRTAFIMLVAEMLIYFWLSYPTKLMRNIVFSMFVIGAVYYLVMNVESFYRVLGVRLESLFALFGGGGEVDHSAYIRDVFIENGKRWFWEQPIVGYGLNNYKVLNQPATGRFTYAHNNFIEIAVDLGVVGFIWYYSVYVYLIPKLLGTIKNNSTNILLLSALIASLLSHYGTVSYYDFYQNFLLQLCFFAIYNAKKERLKSCQS